MFLRDQSNKLVIAELSIYEVLIHSLIFEKHSAAV